MTKSVLKTVYNRTNVNFRDDKDGGFRVVSQVDAGRHGSGHDVAPGRLLAVECVRIPAHLYSWWGLLVRTVVVT